MNAAAVGVRRGASYTLIYAILVSVAMLFAAFTSAMVIRRGASKDWKGTPAPQLLWINTGVLAASSAAAETARRTLRSGNRRFFNVTWAAATLLGFLFLAGQWTVWRQLRASGVFLNSNPGSAFFYVGTAAHAIHLFGGLIAMSVLCWHALRLQLGPG